jgi:hypothetical protein
MDRARQLRGDHLRHRRETAGVEAFHVGRAAAVNAAIALGQPERIVRPYLAVDRDHVGVP